jgi:2-amino-4-hydroxy-6-hydroxymethyldihydropteridine diphosphokinase
VAGDDAAVAPPLAELARDVMHRETIHRRARLTRADDARSFTPCQRQLLARRRSASDDPRRARDFRLRDIAYIALGSNLGDRNAHLAQARAALAALPGSRLLAVSGIEETAPLGGPAQGPYLNQMAALETTLEPRALLAALQHIERDAGRTRDARWGPRTLDLDIVMLGSQRVDEPDLTVPHRGLETRDFWRRELMELGAMT